MFNLSHVQINFRRLTLTLPTEGRFEKAHFIPCQGTNYHSSSTVEFNDTVHRPTLNFSVLMFMYLLKKLFMVLNCNNTKAPGLAENGEEEERRRWAIRIKM